MSSIKFLIRLLLREAVREMFLENSCTFHNRQIVLHNIVILRSSLAQIVQAVHHRDFGRVRQAKQIKPTQVYDKH